MLLAQQYARFLCGDKDLGDCVFAQAEADSDPSLEHIGNLVRSGHRTEAPLIRLQMPEDQIVALLLSVNLPSYEDIARALNLPIGTVKSRINRARVHLGALTAAGRKELADTIRSLSQ